MTREERLVQLGYPLDRTPKPAALYQLVALHENVAYVSGMLPLDGEKLTCTGALGAGLSVETARQAAALCAANVLRVLRQELGDLQRVSRVLRVGGYVHSTSDFAEQHLVINGASQLFLDVLGEAGRHARSAIGVSSLPLAASVEVDAIIALTPH